MDGTQISRKRVQTDSLQFFKSTKGKHTTFDKQPDEAAEFLSHNIWGNGKSSNEENTPKKNIENIFTEDLGIGTDRITLKEIKSSIKQLKRRKTPGPEKYPIEYIKEMDEESVTELQTLMDELMNNEELGDNITNAKVVLIFKKGDKEI